MAAAIIGIEQMFAKKREQILECIFGDKNMLTYLVLIYDHVSDKNSSINENSEGQ